MPATSFASLAAAILLDFISPKSLSLLMIIDECTDPDACEYVELPDGGITWESPAISKGTFRSSNIENPRSQLCKPGTVVQLIRSFANHYS